MYIRKLCCTQKINFQKKVFIPPKYAPKCLSSTLLRPAAGAGIKLPSIAFPLRANLGVETDPALRFGLAATIQQHLEKQEWLKKCSLHTMTTHHVCVTIAGRSTAITGTGGLLAVQVTARSTLLEVLVLLTRGDRASQGPSPLHAKALHKTLAGKLSCPLAHHLLGIFCSCTELPLTGRLIWTRVEQP